MTTSSLKISILITAENHPIYPGLRSWTAYNQVKHSVELVTEARDLQGGDLLFLISCNEFVPRSVRERYVKSLVVHASDLPRGKGWSPHIWEILGGAKEITVTLLEAADEIDSGDVWKKVKLPIPTNFIAAEINSLLFNAELALMNYAVKNFFDVKPIKQPLSPDLPTWRKRSPEDSELNVNESIASQFDLLRVSDPERYPAFFVKDGRKFILKLEVEDD